METNNLDKTGDKPHKSNSFERDHAGSNAKDAKERQVTTEGRGRILLGLRYSRNRLNFLFKSHGGEVKRLVFRVAGLADKQWHTLVLAVNGHSVKLTVDCSSPLEM